MSGTEAEVEEAKTESATKALSAFDPCKYVCVYMWFDRPISGEGTSSPPMQFWAKRYDPSDLCCEFYDFSKIYTGAGKGKDGAIWSDEAAKVVADAQQAETTAGGGPGIQVGVNMIDVADRADLRGSGMTDEEIVAKAIEELHESLPTARKAKLIRSVVNHVPMAIPRPVVNTESLRPLPGRLLFQSGDSSAAKDLQTSGVFLAGDWTQTHFPACMETATQSGFLCAEDVIAAATAAEKPAATPLPLAGDRRPGQPREPQDERWAEPRPRDFDFATLPSRHILWPLVRGLTSWVEPQAAPVAKGR